MEAKQQLNQRVPKKLCQKFHADADRQPRKITKDILMAAILEDFFKAWTISERAVFYKKYYESKRGEK